MLEVLDGITKGLVSQNPELKDCRDIELKIALTLMLYQVIPADGAVLECEMDRIAKLVARRFGVSREIVAGFIDTVNNGEAGKPQLDDLARFALKSGNRKLLIALIRDLWDIAVCDNNLHEQEELMIYRISDSLGIGRREVIEQQARVCR